jgi:hypothetical protein
MDNIVSASLMLSYTLVFDDVKSLVRLRQTSKIIKAIVDGAKRVFNIYRDHMYIICDVRGRRYGKVYMHPGIHSIFEYEERDGVTYKYRIHEGNKRSLACKVPYVNGKKHGLHEHYDRIDYEEEELCNWSSMYSNGVNVTRM